MVVAHYALSQGLINWYMYCNSKRKDKRSNSRIEAGEGSIWHKHADCRLTWQMSSHLIRDWTFQARRLDDAAGV